MNLPLLSTHWFTGLLLGGLLATGLLLILRGVPWTRRITLADRLDPYLQDTPRPSGLLTAHRREATGLAAAVAPVITDLARWVERIMGGASSVRRRQERAGLAADVDSFRAEQVLWGLAGGAIGLIVGLVAVVGRGESVVIALLMTGIGIGTGVAGRDWYLSHQASERESRMLAEFPTVAELLALAVAAGEGAVGALDRVTRLSHGELSGELARCLADARAGASLPVALQGLADRTGLVSLSRFVDGMVVAVERGTPLADVLRAQAQDVREEGRRRVMEEAGQKEILMMIPVVFIILPVTILFLVFPGFQMLRFTL
ncbi:type II secretion system F family protein [Kribbia dieselivorans]|uniref:type II secretion system F family protein n=1 Tax=Kribbia dieselivorans TaxID=331526 RepID=UPI0008388212|nr:type II secretion system F family protein [Kribbia dieselivorans]